VWLFVTDLVTFGSNDAGWCERDSEHKENFDLGHGVCQALTGAKLHKTNIKDTTGFTCSPARVKGIGPRMSKVSDITTLQVPLYA
jgi:hypothetical protein